MVMAVLAGLGMFAGVSLLTVAATGQSALLWEKSVSADGVRRRLMRIVNDRDKPHLRLSGVTEQKYVFQKIAGLFGGAAVGTLLGLVRGWHWTSLVTLILATTCVGWWLPLLGARDTAKKTRREIDQVIRVWVSLVSQQVAAGADPSTAMLSAARAGHRPTWQLLHRHLLAALQQGRPAWEGLDDMVSRYGIHSLMPVVSTLGVAAQQGTRLAEAVLVAADSLWRESTSRERERAARRAQIIVLPATGIALALAGILVYPPFVSLTGATGGP